MAGIGARAVIAAEHVLCVLVVAAAPGFVCDCGDEAGAVVALVEAYCDEAFALGGWSEVVAVDELGCEGCHAFLGLETGVQHPEAGYFVGGGWELGEAVGDCLEAGDDMFDFGDWGWVRNGLCG